MLLLECRLHYVLVVYHLAFSEYTKNVDINDQKVTAYVRRQVTFGENIMDVYSQTLSLRVQ